MSFLSNAWRQLAGVWQSASMAGKAAFATATLVCVGIIVGVGVWSAQPEYVPLATDLSPKDAAEIKSKLDTEGITNKLNYSGSAVLVAKQDFSRARLAVGDQYGRMAEDEADWSSSLWLDPMTKHIRAVRQLEQSLGSSIMQMDAVEWARVHISLEESSPFARDRVPPKASVILKLRPTTAAIDPTQSVIAVVMGGVEGLDPSSISISDSRGRVMHSGSDALAGQLSQQMDYRRNLELELAARAERMLARALGVGKAVVRVTADVDFTDIQRIETVFDPDGKVKRTENITTKDKTGFAPNSMGFAGAAGNLPGAGGGQTGATPTSDKEETITTEYELNKKIDTVSKPGGTIKRLTVAAMVDLGGAADPAAAAPDGAVAAPSVTVEQVERIIRNAIGFDETRLDQIEVVATTLNGDLATDVDGEDALVWDRYSSIARQASLGVASLVAFALGLLILRKLKRVTAEPGGQPAQSDRSRAFNELAELVRRDPETMSRVIVSWLNAKSAPGSDSSASAPRATQPKRAAA